MAKKMLNDKKLEWVRFQMNRILYSKIYRPTILNMSNIERSSFNRNITIIINTINDKELRKNIDKEYLIEATKKLIKILNPYLMDELEYYEWQNGSHNIILNSEHKTKKGQMKDGNRSRAY